jgi:DNA-directed RNA polymerase subunit RPC12/RpoP
MITIVVFEESKERREGLIVSGKLLCACQHEYLFHVGKEIRCPRCGVALLYTENGMIMTGLWKK